MGQYRLYLMNRQSGHIDHVREFEAESDSGAIRIASDWQEDGPMELWSRHHKLRRWDHERVAAPPVPA